MSKSKTVFSLVVAFAAFFMVSAASAVEAVEEVAKTYTAKECKDKFCPSSATTAPPKAPVKKKFIAPKAPVQPALVICEAPATKITRPDGTAYCECGTGRPARMIDAESRHPGNVMKGVCMATQAELEELRNRVDIVCKGSSAQDCANVVATIDRLDRWQRELTSPPQGSTTPALTWIAWDEVYQRTGAQLDAITNVYCPPIKGRPEASLEERCRAEHDAFCKKGDPECSGGNKGDTDVTIGAMVLPLIRFGAPATIGVGGELKVIFWFDPSSMDGLSVMGIAGVGFNEWSKSLVTGAEVSYVRALNQARMIHFHAGVLGVVEPNDAGNNASTLLGQIGFLFSTGHFYGDISGGIGPGKLVLQARPARGAPFEPTGGLSDWAAILAFKASLGLNF